MNQIFLIIKAIIYTFLLALFTGLVIISIGTGALITQLHQPGLILLEKEFATDITLKQQHFSYKPGQSGTTLNYIFTNQTGETKDVTLRVITYSGLFYTLVIMILGLIISLVQTLKTQEKTIKKYTDKAVSSTFQIAILISFGTMAVVTIWGIGTVIYTLIKSW